MKPDLRAYGEWTPSGQIFSRSGFSIADDYLAELCYGPQNGLSGLYVLPSNVGATETNSQVAMELDHDEVPKPTKQVNTAKEVIGLQRSDSSSLGSLSQFALEHESHTGLIASREWPTLQPSNWDDTHDEDLSNDDYVHTREPPFTSTTNSGSTTPHISSSLELASLDPSRPLIPIKETTELLPFKRSPRLQSKVAHAAHLPSSETSPASSDRLPTSESVDLDCVKTSASLVLSQRCRPTGIDSMAPLQRASLRRSVDLLLEDQDKHLILMQKNSSSPPA